MNEAAVGILLVLIFFAFAGLMYAGKLPALLALPLMAASLSITAGLFSHHVAFKFPGSNFGGLMKDFIKVVIEDGMVKLWKYGVTVTLGAVLAELLKESGVSKAIIRWASELGGDNKYVMTFLLTAATAFLFLVLGGLGSVIMVASIVLPILTGLGVSPVVAGSLFLLAMSLGGAFNFVNLQFFVEMMGVAGISQSKAMSDILMFDIPFSAAFLLVIIIFVIVNVKKTKTSFWAIPRSGKKNAAPVSVFALFTPLVPMVIVFGFKSYSLYYQIFRHTQAGYDFPLNSALLIGILYCLATMGPGPSGRVQRLTKASIEAVKSVAPVLALIIGIGMVINVVWDPTVGGYMEPLLKSVVKGNPILYVLVFTIGAPLALYRGPLNVWGMGIAIGGIIIKTGILPAAAVMAALFSVGMVQGVSDPTNTHNAWIAGFLGEDVQKFTKRTIAYTWALTTVGLCIGAVMFLMK